MYKAMNKTKIRSLVATAYSDGFFDSRELYIINQRAKELGLDSSEIIEIIRNPEVGEFISPITQEEKLEFMFDLMKVIYADKLIDESEIKIFYKYLNKLSFRNEVHDSIFNVIKEAVQNDISFDSFLSKNYRDGK
jgi:uncharacterized tellurite resistance protein B-like protein